MSGVVSFGNVVNSLRAVRDDYNEHLKSVPQYEAFLLVESSTQKVADTLQGIGSATPSMAAEVVAALETAKAKFREHLASVPEYRALLAIDKLISDVSADLGIDGQQLAPVQPEADATAMSVPSTVEPMSAEQMSSDQQAISPESTAGQTATRLDAVLLIENPDSTAEATDAAQTTNAIAEVLAAVAEAGAIDETPLDSGIASQTVVAERTPSQSDETVAASPAEQPDSSARVETETFGQTAEKAA